MKKILEIFFDVKYQFQYMYLEDVRVQHPQYDDCKIYMIMLGNKYEIIQASCNKSCLNITYKCLGTDQVDTISNIQLFPFILPDDYINIGICNYGTGVEFEITETGKKFIYDNYYEWGKATDMDGKIKKTIYDLISISGSFEKTMDVHEILYIGQAGEKGQKDIYDRLNTHEKILKVYRDYNIQYRNRELIALIMRPKTKLISDVTINPLTTIVVGNSLWKDTDEIGQKLSDKNVVNIIEAMLIFHFKPKYNIKLKDAIPSLKYKTYSELSNAGVDQIYLSLDLCFESNHQISLFSDTISMNSKMRILRCHLDNSYNKQDECDIVVEDISDKEYKLLNT